MSEDFRKKIASKLEESAKKNASKRAAAKVAGDKMRTLTKKGTRRAAAKFALRAGGMLAAGLASGGASAMVNVASELADSKSTGPRKGSKMYERDMPSDPKQHMKNIAKEAARRKREKK